jgi:hypothetical protein
VWNQHAGLLDSLVYCFQAAHVCLECVLSITACKVRINRFFSFPTTTTSCRYRYGLYRLLIVYSNRVASNRFYKRVVIVIGEQYSSCNFCSPVGFLWANFPPIRQESVKGYVIDAYGGVSADL